MTDNMMSAVAVALMTLLVFNDASAEEACPPDISPADSIVTEWKGLPLETPGYVNIRGAWLKVPIGYWFWEPVDKRDVLLRPPSERTDPPVDSQTFIFWMPSGRWPERFSAYIVPFFRFCEPGRPRPGRDDYVVSFHLQWAGVERLDQVPYVLPGEQIENVKERFGDPLDGREYGLLSFSRPFLKSEQYYSSAADESFQLLMGCALPDQFPHPSCEGDVYWPEEKLLFWFHLSQRDLPHWRATIEMARAKVVNWRIAAPSKKINQADHRRLVNNQDIFAQTDKLIFQNKCHMIWSLLWPMAKSGNKEAFERLSKYIYIGGLQVPGVNDKNSKAKSLIHALALSDYAFGTDRRYIIPSIMSQSLIYSLGTEDGKFMYTEFDNKERSYPYFPSQQSYIRALDVELKAEPHQTCRKPYL